MRIIDTLVRGKRWLAYGSFAGGALGALLMNLNEVINAHAQLAFGIRMGLPLATALGMIGGMIGGAAGSFIAGRLAKEEVVLNVGESLGVGLLNGFLSGTAFGVALGFAHRWKPELLSAGPLVILMAVVIAVTVSAFLRKGPSERS